MYRISPAPPLAAGLPNPATIEAAKAKMQNDDFIGLLPNSFPETDFAQKGRFTFHSDPLRPILTKIFFVEGRVHYGRKKSKRNRGLALQNSSRESQSRGTQSNFPSSALISFFTSADT